MANSDAMTASQHTTPILTGRVTELVRRSVLEVAWRIRAILRRYEVRLAAAKSDFN